MQANLIQNVSSYVGIMFSEQSLQEIGNRWVLTAVEVFNREQLSFFRR